MSDLATAELARDQGVASVGGTGHMTADIAAPVGQLLGYARVSTGHQSLDQQLEALTAAGIEPARVYSDRLSGATLSEQRPGLAALHFDTTTDTDGGALNNKDCVAASSRVLILGQSIDCPW